MSFKMKRKIFILFKRKFKKVSDLNESLLILFNIYKIKFYYSILLFFLKVLELFIFL